MLELRHLKIEDKELIEKFMPSCCRQMCDFTFGNLFCWSGAEHTEIALKDGFLFLRATFNGVTSYAFPWGEGDVYNALAEIVEDSASRGADLSFFCVASEQLVYLEKFFGQRLIYKEQRDYFDYVYFSDKLATLSGRRLHSKKNHVNSFMKRYNYTFSVIDESNLQACLHFSHKWFMDNQSTQRLEAERQVIDTAFRHYKALGFLGGVLKVDGRIVAYCLGERMYDGETFCVHFEKADKDFPTAYAAVNKLFAELLVNEYKYINREDDSGVEGLRKAKTSYQPEALVKKYYAKII